VFGPKVLNSSAIVICGGPGDGEPLLLHDLSSVTPEGRAKLINQGGVTERKNWEALVRADPHLTYFASGAKPSELLSRLRAGHRPLSEFLIGSIQRGVTPDVVAAHVLSTADVEQFAIEKDLLRLSVSGTQIRRYAKWVPDQHILYVTRDVAIQAYPIALRYLSQFRSANSCPEVRDKKHPWWALHRPRNPEIFVAPKFVGLTTTRAIEVIHDSALGLYVTDAMYVFRIAEHIDPMAFMAVMHSKCFLFLYRVSNQGEGRVIPQVKASKLEPLPFPDLAERKDLSDRLAVDCRAMIDAKQKIAEAASEKQREYYGIRCQDLERRIDASVYQLYELTAAQVECIESFMP
jgi:adenine-specific DNA-methyltransferase